MTDLKDPNAQHSEYVSTSDVDDTEKAKRNSICGGHAESLNDLEDPDAGKSAEERADIVCATTQNVRWREESNMIAGQETRKKDRSLAHPMALSSLFAQFPW